MSNIDDRPSMVSQRDYEALASFRFELRRFLNFSQRAAKTFGMTPQQHQSLLAIRAAIRSRLTIGDLADQLFIKPHTASGLVDRMAVLGWLERNLDVHDGRRITLSLTPKAEEILLAMSATHKDEVLRIRSTLTDLLAQIGNGAR